MTLYVPIGGHRGGSKRVYARVDNEDLDLVKGHKWSVSTWQRIAYAFYKYEENGERKAVIMHRLITNFQWECVDHIDGDGLNNVRSNLREASPPQNGANFRRKTTKTMTSIYKGVSWDKRTNKWMVRIKKNGEAIYLGLYLDEIEAAKTYNEAALKYHGEFACINEL